MENTTHNGQSHSPKEFIADLVTFSKPAHVECQCLFLQFSFEHAIQSHFPCFNNPQGHTLLVGELELSDTEGLQFEAIAQAEHSHQDSLKNPTFSRRSHACSQKSQ